MISEYVDKDNLILNLMEYFDPETTNIDWDSVIESGVAISGYYAYFVPINPCVWLLTDPMTGVVMDMIIGVEDIDYAFEGV